MSSMTDCTLDADAGADAAGAGVEAGCCAGVGGVAGAAAGEAGLAGEGWVTKQKRMIVLCML